MATYVTVSKGEIGEEAIPILATSDPEIVAIVMNVFAQHLFDEGQRTLKGNPLVDEPV